MKRKLLMTLMLAGALTMVPVSFGPATQVQAALPGNEEVVQPRYVNTINIAADLVINGNTAHCYSSATKKKVCRINIKMRLQRKSGSSWITVCTWTGTSDTGTKSMDKTFTLSTHGTYRVNAEFDVAGEVLTYNSRTQTY